MTRTILLRSLTAAALPLLTLVSCGRSHDDAASAPVPSPSPSAARPAAPAPGAAAAPAPPTPLDTHKPAATVNGRPIPAAKVYSVYRMNQQMLLQRGRQLSGNDDQALKAQSLEAVIADELLYQAALAQGVTVPPAEIEAAVKQLKARAGSDEAYKKFLAESGVDDADVYQEIGRNMKTAAYGKSLVGGKAVTEDQAKKFYDANVGKGMFNVPEQVHVQFILVRATDKDPESVRSDAKKRAEEAAKRATAGEDFTALVKQYSQDQTASRGGDIGLVPRGVLFPSFEDVAFSSKPGTVSPVFETPKGFNVLKVLEKNPESTRTYDEVKSALMEDLGRLMEQDAVRAKIQELAASAKIAIFDPAFARPAPPPQAAGSPAPAKAPPPPKP